MKKTSPRLFAALLLAWMGGAACSGGAARPSGTPSPSVPPPYPAAVEFVTGMIHHHAQAIVMARMADSHGANQSIRTLSARIIASQEDEIGLMSTWLRDNGQPVPDPNPRGMRMVMGGMEHEMLMPGMLTEEQMRQLDQARGAGFERLFLQGMIQHHEGALQMVETVFNSYGGTVDEWIYKFASDVQADQTAEIDRMTRMLDAMPPGGFR